MKTETWVLGSGAFFFIPLGVVYGFLTGFEPVGFAALLLTGGLSLIMGLYLYLVSLRVDDRPEDDPRAEIAEGAANLGFFNPGSYWPLLFAGAAGVMFLGMAIGVWLFLIGIGLVAITALGFVFEHYTGDFEH